MADFSLMNTIVRWAMRNASQRRPAAKAAAPALPVATATA
jgi:hypothetical protein